MEFRHFQVSVGEDGFCLLDLNVQLKEWPFNGPSQSFYLAFCMPHILYLMIIESSKMFRLHASHCFGWVQNGRSTFGVLFRSCDIASSSYDVDNSKNISCFLRKSASYGSFFFSKKIEPHWIVLPIPFSREVIQAFYFSLVSLTDNENCFCLSELVTFFELGFSWKEILAVL